MRDDQQVEETLAALDSIAGAGKPRARPASTATAVILTCADSVKITAVRWLWRDWLARGKLHLIAGTPGTGKTTIALAAAATLTRGERGRTGRGHPLGML